MINIPKGTKDVLPQDSYKWQYLEQVARDVCKLYNALEIRTPVFEHTELFTRSIGDDTDVVSKEMYTFLDKGNRSITLKPEGTASVARSYIENTLEANSLPLKMFYFSPVFRYERPQAGRLREHHQFGVEFYGGSSPCLDMEVISLAHKFLSKLGITQLSLRLNSIGCPKCRGVYNDALKGYLKANLNALCPTCQIRFENNPLRILDCKVDSCKEIVKNAPKIIDFICEDCSKHMEDLKKMLKGNNIIFEIDPNIVRGLDYYTKTVFEFVTTALGAQGTVCGGGRYDNLVESVGGKSTPCVGFGLGLERLIMLLEALNIDIPNCSNVKVFVICQAPENLNYCLNLVKILRDNEISCDTEYMGRSLKAQFKYADKINAENVIVIGENEVNLSQVKIKRLCDGYTETVNTNEIVNFLRR